MVSENHKNDAPNYEKDALNYANDTLKQYITFSALLTTLLFAMVPFLFKGGSIPRLPWVFVVSLFCFLSTTLLSIFCQMRIVPVVMEGKYDPYEKYFAKWAAVAAILLFVGIISLVGFFLVNFNDLIGKTPEKSILKIDLTEDSAIVEGENWEYGIERDEKTGKVKRVWVRR